MIISTPIQHRRLKFLGIEYFHILHTFIKFYRDYFKLKLLIKEINLLFYFQGKEEVSRGDVKYMSFLGIPYAQPPVGENRFRKPVPAKG